MLFSIQDELIDLINDVRSNSDDQSIEYIMSKLCTLEVMPSVSIVGIGGFPIKKIDRDYYIFNTLITRESMVSLLHEQLGSSAVLTRLNSSSLNIDELAEICINRNHKWSLHQITVTMMFVAPPFVEMSFNRSQMFMKGGSWIESPINNNGNRIFTIPGSLKTWKDYLKNRNSSDFFPVQRKAMNSAYDILNYYFPDAMV